MPIARKPIAAFFVLAGCLMVAASFGFRVGGIVIEKASPFVAFGFNGQHIKAIAIHKNLIAFSNGVRITGIKLLPYDIIFFIVSAALIFGLLMVFVQIAIMILKRVKPTVAAEIVTWRKGLWKEKQRSA